MTGGRRRHGLVVLVLAVLAVLVVPNLTGRELAGSPQTGSIPPPPHVGECLLQAPAAAGTGRSYRLGPCTAVHFGEVAAVVSDSTAAPGSAGSCPDSRAYLGWRAPVRSTARASWRPIDVTLLRLTPTRLQQGFGQRWLACVVMPVVPGAGYTGAVRDSLRTGHLPLPFAQCLVSITSLTGSVACTDPHPYEVFGFADLPVDFRDQPDLDADCRSMVATDIGRPDVSADGALAVRAVPFHWDATGTPRAGLPTPGDQSAEAVCVVAVTAHHLLHGSLFGIGMRPLPWA